MPQQKLCVSVPIELRCYQKIKDMITETNLPEKENEFGIKIVKNILGAIDFVAYYSDTGDLLKRVYYKGTDAVKVRHYRNSYLYLEEDFSGKLMIKKRIYDTGGNILTQYQYKYNRNGEVTGIEKHTNKNKYYVEYGYDELKRVNARKIYINNALINEQKYRYDILDRLVDYQDSSQHVHVNLISQNNELLSYVVKDKLGNEIKIENYFKNSEYVNTDISMNGHNIRVKDISYADNVVLKKPYTTESDLELVVSELYTKPEMCQTKRSCKEDSVVSQINEEAKKPILPISVRKRLLFNPS